MIPQDTVLHTNHKILKTIRLFTLTESLRKLNATLQCLATAVGKWIHC